MSTTGLVCRKFLLLFQSYVPSASRSARLANSTLFTLALWDIRVQMPALFGCMAAFISCFLPATQTSVIINLLYPRLAATLLLWLFVVVYSGSSSVSGLVRPASSSITRTRSHSISFLCCAFSALAGFLVGGTPLASANAGYNVISTSSMI